VDAKSGRLCAVPLVSVSPGVRGIQGVDSRKSGSYLHASFSSSGSAKNRTEASWCRAMRAFDRPWLTSWKNPEVLQAPATAAASSGDGDSPTLSGARKPPVEPNRV
jgi:hypothetical protein